MSEVKRNYAGTVNLAEKKPERWPVLSFLWGVVLRGQGPLPGAFGCIVNDTKPWNYKAKLIARTVTDGFR